MDASTDVEYPPGCQPIPATINNNERIKRLKVSVAFDFLETFNEKLLH
ncbi:unnamed protein product [Toxocara canis]|uniref:Uncharacterized protein n=1 Tax=Toxocara canis TaxID=6265 RepID=A0A183UZV9_TOXCA|nr:unnamed protein product [Toxocara canis]